MSLYNYETSSVCLVCLFCVCLSVVVSSVCCRPSCRLSLLLCVLCVLCVVWSAARPSGQQRALVNIHYLRSILALGALPV